MVDVAALRSRVTCPVLTPEDDGFTEEVLSWARTFTHTPDVAVGATSAADVVEAVKFARANGLAVRVQGTGHGAESSVTDGVLILTRRLNQISIDPSTRTATLGAGVEWNPVIAEAATHGLAPITGSSGTVGAIGFLLGGGLGPLARSHGFASDYVRSFEVVTAEGELVRASADEHPELFWALRGGKGGLAVVTEVQLELVELNNLYGGSLMFDAENIEPALRAWVDYTITADPRVTTSAVILRMPDLPFIPEPRRGHTLLSVRFAFPGDAEEGEALAAPLRAAAPVYIDALGEMQVASIGSIHNDPPDPTVGWTKGHLLAGADQDFTTTLLGFAGYGREFPFVATEVRHIGSATAKDVTPGSAVGGRSATYTFNLVGVPNPELFDTVLPRAAGALTGAIAPWASLENNVNFGGKIESRADYEAMWSPEIFARLGEVRKTYDPTGVFAYGVS
jgi:UDP-N-acetylenolpyruvoylglucosamine reductase